MDIDLLLGGQLRVQPKGTFGYVIFSQNPAQQNFLVACHAQLVMALNAGGDSPNGITFGSKTGVQAKTFALSSTTTSSSSSTVTTSSSSSSASSSGTTIWVSVSSPTSSQPLSSATSASQANGANTGAKAGIGIGAAIVCFVVTGLL
jgi:hypothetical protein